MVQAVFFGAGFVGEDAVDVAQRLRRRVNDLGCFCWLLLRGRCSHKMKRIMIGVEVEFTYQVTGASQEQWSRLAAHCERIKQLNSALVGYDLQMPTDDDTGFAVFRSAGHDQSAIKRRLVAPIQAAFYKAEIHVPMIQLVGTRVLPNGRSKTLAEGRTPKGTFTDPNLGQMLADYGATLRESASGGA